MRAIVLSHLDTIRTLSMNKSYLVRFFFRDKNAIVYNAHCGHMLRTKLEKSNEGGVAAGSGALDSPYLYDDWDRGVEFDFATINYWSAC